jgi:hypothetical protein
VQRIPLCARVGDDSIRRRADAESSTTSMLCATADTIVPSAWERLRGGAGQANPSKRLGNPAISHPSRLG